MNTSIRCLTRWCAGALLLSALTHASAQAPYTSAIDPTTGLPAPEKPIPETWQKEIKNFAFDGIPLGEVIIFLRDQAPEINFIITPEAAEYELPPVRLNSITLEDVFTAMRIVSKGEIRISPESATMVSVTRSEPGERPQKPKKQCVAYSLNRYLHGKRAEEVEALMKGVEHALDQCWRMLADANNSAFERPALSLHAPTKMLIAVGDPDQLQVIEQIVRQLELGAESGAGTFGGGYGLPGGRTRYGGGDGGGGYGPGGGQPGAAMPGPIVPEPSAAGAPPSRPSTNAPGSRK